MTEDLGLAGDILTLRSYSDPAAVERYSHSLSEHRDGRIMEEIAQVCDGLVAPAPVLDVGSGTGEVVSRIRERGHMAIGVDYSPAMVRFASRQYGPHFSVGDARDLSQFVGESFEAVVTVACLHHLVQSDLSRAISEMTRVLRPGGRLLLVTKVGIGEVWDLRLGSTFPRLVHLVPDSWYDDQLASNGVSRAGASLIGHGEDGYRMLIWRGCKQ